MPEASPICRGKNLTLETVLAFINAMPKNSMPKSEFHAYAESRLNGWSRTHSQIARQVALYYEKNGICVPRFKAICTKRDVFEYMEKWAKLYFVPNPYTPSLCEYEPRNIYSFLRTELRNGNTSFTEACHHIFNVELNNLDKVRVYLNNFTDLMIDGADDVMSVNQGLSEEDVIPSITPRITDINSTEEFFFYFGGQLGNEENIRNQNMKDLQVIYYGAPGTGKSHYINSKIDKERTIRTTFHPDSDYSSFVGCYKPIEKNNNSDRVYNASELLDILNSFNGEKYQSHKFSTLYWNSLSKLTPKEIKEIISSAGLNETYYQEVIKGMAVGGYIDTLAPKTTGGITYSFVPQAFTNAYVNAWKDLDHVYYLVIEEINRGNCAQIFGDLFQLLDREDDGLSSYAIQPNTDLQNYLARQFAHSDISDAKIKSGEEMRIPTNLCILATMNTSDQSLFPIDSAFKRRWDWKYIPISKGDEEHYIAVNSKLYSWWSFMKIVNDKIEDVTSSEDKQIGYWFAKADSNKQIPTDKFVSKVIFYLWNDVFKDYMHSSANLFNIDGRTYKFREFFRDNGEVNTEVLESFLDGLNIDTKASDEPLVDNTESAAE